MVASYNRKLKRVCRAYGLILVEERNAKEPGTHPGTQGHPRGDSIYNYNFPECQTPIAWNTSLKNTIDTATVMPPHKTKSAPSVQIISSQA